MWEILRFFEIFGVLGGLRVFWYFIIANHIIEMRLSHDSDPPEDHFAIAYEQS